MRRRGSRGGWCAEAARERDRGGGPLMKVEIRRDGPSLIDGYRAVVGDGPIRVLESLARKLHGHRMVMVNSTATGGGVAEILHRLVRLLEELGVPTTWEVMPGDQRFYGITKTIHNTLHGAPGALTTEDHDHYHDMNRRAATALELDGDLILIHDPQPAAFILHRREAHQRWVWRCHIDISHANPTCGGSSSRSWRATTRPCSRTIRSCRRYRCRRSWFRRRSTRCPTRTASWARRRWTSCSSRSIFRPRFRG
jgi:trehalose synthase